MRCLAVILAAAALCAGLAVLPSCVWDPGGSGVSMSRPLKPADCPEGYVWDEQTKRCQKAKPQPD